MLITALSIWEKWKRVAKRIGDFQARLLLTVFYFLLLGPFAIVARLGGDPLGIKPGHPQGWLSRRDGGGDPVELARRQF